MAENKSNNPFKSFPETELQARLKNAKRLTHEEFMQHLKEIQEQKVKDK